MIWIVLDEGTGEYELVEFETSEGKTCVIDPNKVTDEEGVNWGGVGPLWAKDHGTIIILLGSDAYPDTVLGNPDAVEEDLRGLTVFLNTRFWELSGAEVTVVELRTSRKNQWPQGPDDKDDTRRPNNRRIQGARHYLTELKAQDGKLAQSDIIGLEGDRVETEWYLWEGKRPEVHTYAKQGGYIAIRYDNELFHLTSGKVQFRWFGIIEGAVQANLTIILEPQHYKKDGLLWGVHPDQSRSQLIFSGDREKGAQIPLVEWGLEFSENMPEPIRDAIRKARGEINGSIDDEDYRKRLQERFGKRWTMKILIAESIKQNGKKGPIEGQGDAQDGSAAADGQSAGDNKGGQKGAPRKRKNIITIVENSVDGVEREVPVDVPRYAFANADAFEEEWHIAAWAPNYIDGPTVLINLDSPILKESVDYHLKQYSDIYAEEVADTVHRVFGELAACKIAHSQMLKKHIAEQELNNDYRSEKALTISLMGLLAEEAVISKRLLKLGQKKPLSGVTKEIDD